MYIVYLFGTRPAYIVRFVAHKYHAIRQRVTPSTLRTTLFSILYTVVRITRVSSPWLFYWGSFEKYIAQKLYHVTTIFNLMSLHPLRQTIAYFALTIDLDRVSAWKFYSPKRLTITAIITIRYSRVSQRVLGLRVVPKSVSSSALNLIVFLKILLSRVAPEKYNFHDLKINNFSFISCPSNNCILLTIVCWSYVEPHLD